MNNIFDGYIICKCNKNTERKILEQLKISALLEGLNDTNSVELLGGIVHVLSMKDGVITMLPGEDIEDDLMVISCDDVVETTYTREEFMIEFETKIIEFIITNRETRRMRMEIRKQRLANGDVEWGTQDLE